MIDHKKVLMNLANKDKGPVVEVNLDDEGTEARKCPKCHQELPEDTVLEDEEDESDSDFE